MANNTDVLISVVVVTHNRVKFLEKAIESLSDQTLEKAKYEIIVVDNASTDGTKQLVHAKSQLIKNLKYIFEPKAGANNARNIGWQQAAGQYVAYIDDDAVPGKIWLERIVLAFEKINPKPGIVGGKVIPLWESNKPNWLKGKLLKAISVVDYSLHDRFLDSNEFLYSVNMCFQKNLLQQFGGFDEALGRKGKRLTSNDEILIAIKIRNAGYKTYYDPLIAVEHFISSSRLTHEWFIKRYYQQGYSDALMWMLLEKPGDWTKLKKLVYYCYGFIRNPTHLYHLFSTPNDSEKLFFKLNIHARVGFIKGLCQPDE
jgi:glycosyltransferase involved in cell wall biosynthesis